MLVPDLPDELRFLVLYLLEAAKINLLFQDPALLEEALSAITPAEKIDLQSHFPNLQVEYVLSSRDVFMDALASRYLAPILWISPAWLLRDNRDTKLDNHVISDILIDDLILRLDAYLTHTPTIIRIGIYTSWLASAQLLRVGKERLAHVICGSNAPLLQKLVQMIGDASAASQELQVVKDRIRPMSARELSIVLDQVDSESLFASFDTESIAAGSIGQGHLAELIDGTNVFVKVKRYGVAQLMHQEAAIFNSPKDQNAVSPWNEIADNLIKETSFTLEMQNQKLLKRQWTHCETIKIVEVISSHPDIDPTILVMQVAPGTTLGRASIRFPIGLNNAVDCLNALVHQFYLRTLFYDSAEESHQHDPVEPCGYAPADPHAANEMIHVDPITGTCTLTILDTASICTVTPGQRNQIIDLLIAVVMSDANGIATVLGIEYGNVIEWTKSVTIYRKILKDKEAQNDRDSKILKKLVKVVEATKLILKRPALDELLAFGKAQLQLLDTVKQFQTSHAYEMEKLKLRIDPMMDVILLHLKRNTKGNRSLMKRAIWAFSEGAKRKFADSFQAWDWEADGNNGNKIWPFGM